MAQNIWPLVFYTCLIVAITSFVCCGCWILKRITDIRKKREQQTIVEMFRAVMTRRAAVEQGPIYRQRMGPNMRPPGALSPGPQRMQTVPIHPMANGYGSQNERRHVVVDSIDSIPPLQTQNSNGSYNDNGNHAPVANGYIPNNAPAPVANGYISNNASADPVANGYAPNVAPVPVANGYIPGVHNVTPTPVANGFIPSNNNPPPKGKVQRRLLLQ